MIPQQVEKIFTDHQAALPELRLNEHLAEIKAIAADLESHRFSLAVVGEFDTGKSTLINAMIGRDLLPAHAIPTTKRITVLSFGDDDSLAATPDPGGTKLSLTNDNISDLNKDPNISKIEITVRPSAARDFQQFTIIDTPGANDPNELDDKIIFDIVEQADVILFLLNVTQAYKRTEQEFLKRAVAKKDLAKFFFLLNFADTSAESFNVRREVIKWLKADHGVDENHLKNHVLIISGRRALDAVLSGDAARLNESGYRRLGEVVNRFVADNSGRLLSDAFTVRIIKDLDELYTEANLLREQYHRKLSGQDSGLDQLDAQIQAIEAAMKSDRFNLLNNIKREMLRLAERVKAGGDVITDRVLAYIDKEAPDAMTNPRPVEVYAGKLFREMVNDELYRFQEIMQEIIGQFDLSLEQRLSKTPVIFHGQRDTHYLKSGLKVAGMSAAGMAAVIYGPMAAAATAGVGVLGAIGGGVLTALTACGVAVPFMAAAVPAAIGVASTVGVVASGFVSGAWQVVKATAKVVGGWADEAEKVVARSKFKHQIRTSLAAVRDELIANFEKNTDEQLNDWIKDYMASKFPQKKLLERHKEELAVRLKESHEQIRQHIGSLDKFLAELEVERNLLTTNFPA